MSLWDKAKRAGAVFDLARHFRRLMRVIQL